MAFRSYGQNFEDVMLYRALGKVERDFYIDIGAQHPKIDSVSKAFFTGGGGAFMWSRCLTTPSCCARRARVIR